MTATTQSTEKLVGVRPVESAHHEGDPALNLYQDPCAVEDLEVRNLSDHEWRVGDGRCHEGSPAKVLGYIEKCGSAFEVLNLKKPRQVFVFDRFEAAVASLAVVSPK